MNYFNAEEAAARIQARNRYIKLLKDDRKKVRENVRDALDRIDEYVKKKIT